jgi:hypothetical protein
MFNYYFHLLCNYNFLFYYLVGSRKRTCGRFRPFHRSPRPRFQIENFRFVLVSISSRFFFHTTDSFEVTMAATYGAELLRRQFMGKTFYFQKLKLLTSVK